MKYTPETDMAGSVFQLTEDVVNRMKGSSPSRRENQRAPLASDGTGPSSLAAEGKPRPTGTEGWCCHCLLQGMLVVTPL